MFIKQLLKASIAMRGTAFASTANLHSFLLVA